MSMLEAAYADGQWDAFSAFKLAAAPSVTGSSLPKIPGPLTIGKNIVDDDRNIRDIFNTQEQAISRTAPLQKVSEDLCTTCRKPKHYGPCLKPPRTRAQGDPHKRADFNWGMYGDDPSSGDRPSTSPHYHAATSSISSLARAQEGRPAAEQAATGFADLFRHQGITSLSDDARPNQLNSDMRKSAYMPGGTSNLTQTIFEPRGSVNPYEERPQKLSPPVGWSDESAQRIQRAFDQIDGAVDSTCIEGNGAQPSSGPAALG